jgi:hypothetical protein
MLLSAVRMLLASACAMMTGSCSPPPGIYRQASFDQEIDLACVARGMNEVSGLSELYVDIHPGEPNTSPIERRTNWTSATYLANGLTDVLDVNGVSLDISRGGSPVKLNVSHSFSRSSDHGVSKQQVQTAVDIMKRVERAIGAACGLDLVPAMRMDCGPSLYKCEGIV